jgi:hypothetical protein
MKKIRILWVALSVGLVLALAFRVVPAHATTVDLQPIVGVWEGTIDPGAQSKKRIVVHISESQDGSLGGTIDYPDQETSGILITAITYKDLTLHVESGSIQCSYDGVLNGANSEIKGTWKEGGGGLVLVLKRTSYSRERLDGWKTISG